MDLVIIWYLFLPKNEFIFRFHSPFQLVAKQKINIIALSTSVQGKQEGHKKFIFNKNLLSSVYPPEYT